MKNIRIGTRNSPLALWQAQEVEQKLKDLSFSTEIVPIVSMGDKNLAQPLYSMGITGVFTKDLDIALLNHQVDIAVHSLKDIPTILPKGIGIGAYLERDFPQDVLVRNQKSKNKNLKDLKIATSSLRRRAFWAKEFPETEFLDIRGNVNTRLEKIENGLADATLFSLAGIKRLGLNIDYELLPFMLSAPSQGVVAVTFLQENSEIQKILNQINHQKTQICVEIERDFLNQMQGGCTAPIGAEAIFVDEKNISFKGRLTSLDGQENLEIHQKFSYVEDFNFGGKMAKEILENGGKELMQSIKKQMEKS